MLLALRGIALASVLSLVLTGCGGGSSGSKTVAPVEAAPLPVVGVKTSAIATFSDPWAMVVLPDGRLLVTERPPWQTPSGERYKNPISPGRIRLVTTAGLVSEPLAGLPANAGILDVQLSPQFAANQLVYLSFIEPDPSAARVGRDKDDLEITPAGLAVATARIVFDAAGGARLDQATVIWRQTPKIVSFPGSGEYGSRMTFSPDGTYLFIAAGDRQEYQPVQDPATTLGKVVRLFADGRIPPTNPYYGQAGKLPEIWTLGHRNPYGLAFDAAGQLWEHEMGPMGGDEVNLLTAGSNYGWPNVSQGDNYDSTPIPRHAPGDGFVAPALSWTPVIAPAGMIFYTGKMFGDWRGDAIITGLQSQGLVRVRMDGTTAREMQRVPMGARIRDVRQSADGALWVLEDAPNGRLLRLEPIF